MFTLALITEVLSTVIEGEREEENYWIDPKQVSVSFINFYGIPKARESRQQKQLINSLQILGNNATKNLIFAYKILWNVCPALSFSSAFD